MSTRFETDKDLSREKKAIQYFVKRFNGSFKKLDPNDIDYKIFDEDGKLIAYAEVKGRYKNIDNCYPLPVACRKIVKLCDKRLNPVIIWPREGAVNDQEIMIYYDKQKTLRYFRYY